MKREFIMETCRLTALLEILVVQNNILDEGK